MFQEHDAALEMVIGHRLDELLAAGHITESVRQVANQGGWIAWGIMVGYLDTCFDMASYVPA